MAIFLNILIDALPQRKRLIPYSNLWKKKSSLDEKEEESDDQEEEEWSSYPCLPSNESNSSTHTLFYSPPKEDEGYIDKCDDPIDSFEISLLTKLILAILVNLMLV